MNLTSRHKQKSQTTSFIYRSTEKDNTNGHTISRGYGVTGTATLAMTTATTDTLQVLLKRGKRCSRRKSKCNSCVDFFFAHRETNTQRNQREGKTNISLKTFVFVAFFCAP